MKQALLYNKQTGGKVQCRVCSHFCTLNKGQLGVCRVRKNIGGELFSLNYDKVAASNPDPIEKKPLYHFLPGTISYSIATMGCNFKCRFCQNHSLSMVENENAIYGKKISPKTMVATAQMQGAKSISYTYSEPTIYFELMYETAQLAKAEGLKNVMVTNGYMSADALDMMEPYLDAANIDLKAFSDEFYKKYSSARLAPVLDTIKAMKSKGIWVELTTLLIPGLNTDPKELNDLVDFILSIDADMPWHVSRFYPQYKLLDVPPTDPNAIFAILEKARDKGLKYLYGGNVMSDQWANTVCPSCGTLLVERSGYHTTVQDLSAGVCSHCNEKIAGVFA